MAYYFAEGQHGIVRFDDDPQTNSKAYAEEWTPYSEEWGPKGRIAYDVIWSGDYYPIPESAVPEMQQRCRDLLALQRANGLA